MEQGRCEEGQGSALASLDVEGNGLTLLPGGADRFAALLHLIGNAQLRLDLCFYIFDADSVGNEVRDALVDACKRGVAVTLLVDAFGSATTPALLFAPLIAAGARFGKFGKRRSTRYLFRNHQKMVIADGRQALVGGFNVAHAYFTPDDDRRGFRDLGLLVEGPLAARLAEWFDALADWTLGTRQSFRALRRLVRDWQPGEGRAVWLMGGPTRHLNGWARRIKHDLQRGRRLELMAAYFSPSWGMVRRIGAIAQRGSARLVVPARSDHIVTIGAARHFYRRLLSSDLAIFEFLPQKLHTKAVVVDDIAYVGSANFDMRSLFLNVELMLRVEDPDFAATVRAEADALAAQSRRIDMAIFRAMAGPLTRLRWWLDYLIVAVLDFTVTRRLNFRRDRNPLD